MCSIYKLLQVYEGGEIQELTKVWTVIQNKLAKYGN